MFLKQCWCTYAAYTIYRWLVNLRAGPDRHRDDWLFLEPSVRLWADLIL